LQVYSGKILTVQDKDSVHTHTCICEPLLSLRGTNAKPGYFSGKASIFSRLTLVKGEMHIGNSMYHMVWNVCWLCWCRIRYVPY